MGVATRDAIEGYFKVPLKEYFNVSSSFEALQVVPQVVLGLLIRPTSSAAPFLVTNMHLKSFVKQEPWRVGGLQPLWAHNVGALLVRIGCWGPLYYNYNKEPPKIV